MSISYKKCLCKTFGNVVFLFSLLSLCVTQKALQQPLFSFFFSTENLDGMVEIAYSSGKWSDLVEIMRIIQKNLKLKNLRISLTLQGFIIKTNLITYIL